MLFFCCDFCKLGPKNHRRRQEDIQEGTARLAAASKISLDAAAVAVLPELDGIFILNKDQRTTLMAHVLLFL